MTRPLPRSSSDPAVSMDRKRSQSSKPRVAPGEVGCLTVALAEARAKIAELELIAEVDPLLNILNRRGFERALIRTLDYVKRYRAPAALLYLDLDGFKRINDAYGHAAGDAVLKTVASILARNVRGSDVVARLGGEKLGTPPSGGRGCLGRREAFRRGVRGRHLDRPP